jgi:hypothetical protein
MKFIRRVKTNVLFMTFHSTSSTRKLFLKRIAENMAKRVQNKSRERITHRDTMAILFMRVKDLVSVIEGLC